MGFSLFWGLEQIERCTEWGFESAECLEEMLETCIFSVCIDELNLESLYSGYAANIYRDLRDLGRDQHARHAAALGAARVQRACILRYGKFMLILK